MSLIKLEITEDHLKLLKLLNFTNQDEHLTTQDKDSEKDNAFGYETRYVEMELAINGRPTKFDPTATELFEISDEQKTYLDSLWGEMHLVLELKCFFDHLTPGLYKRKFHDRNWIKI